MVEVVRDEDLMTIRRLLLGLRATLRFFHRIPPDLVEECSDSSTAAAAAVFANIVGSSMKQMTRKLLGYRRLDMTWIP